MATVNGTKLKVGDRVRLKKFEESFRHNPPGLGVSSYMMPLFGNVSVIRDVLPQGRLRLGGESYYTYASEWVEEVIPEVDCDDCKHQPVQTIGVKDIGDECMSCISAGCKTLFEPRVDTKQQSALDTQVAGDHYKTMGIQPIQFAVANKLNSCQTLALRYLTRKKGNTDKIIEDRKKAIHMIQIEIEMIEKGAISFE